MNPKTPAEWKRVTALAEACLLLDSARQYGLVTGGPQVNVDRCVEILDRGKALGYVPSRTEIDAAVERLVAELKE